MVASQVAAQKFFPCSSTTVRPFGFSGETSMKVRDTVWPCEGKWKRSVVKGYSKPSSSGPYTACSSALVGATYAVARVARSHTCTAKFPRTLGFTAVSTFYDHEP